MTRAASVVLRVLGLALVLTAVGGFVLLGADGAWTARAQIPAGRTAVLVEPALASVLGPTITVQVVPHGDPDATDEPVDLFLGRGRSDDLTAYVQGQGVSRVVGVAGSRRLAIRTGPGPDPTLSRAGVRSIDDATAATSRWPPPAAVDLWQQQVSGAQARELSWRPTPGASSILIARRDGSPLPALDVEIVWTDRAWLWIPAVALLLGLLLLGAGLMLRGSFPAAALGTLAAARRSVRSRRASRPVPAAASAGRETGDRVVVGLGRGAAPTSSPGPSPVSPSVAPPDEPPSDEVPSDEVPSGAAVPSADVVAVTPSIRRVARGRRRKPTTWQHVRSAVVFATGWVRRRPGSPVGHEVTRPDEESARGGERS